jgi:acyl carrier protein
MQQLMTEQRVLSEVRKAVAEALRIEPELVEAETSLVADLGAASLDFLDVNYRIEQAFGLRMARHFVLEHAEELYGEGTVIGERGRLTEAGMDLLRQRYGASAVPPGARPFSLDEVPALITTGILVETVLDILETRPERCPCGAGEWVSEDGALVCCSACGEAAPYQDGDERVRAWLDTVEGIGSGAG